MPKKQCPECFGTGIRIIKSVPSYCECHNQPQNQQRPKLKIKIENRQDLFVAKFNLYQAKSIFWLIHKFTDSVGFGFDDFDKDKAFESIAFLTEIGYSTLDSCSEQIDFAEMREVSE